MSLELTDEQQWALNMERGIPTQAMLGDDFNPEDACQAQVESAAEAGWNDPQMEVSNDLEPRRQP